MSICIGRPNGEKSCTDLRTKLSSTKSLRSLQVAIASPGTQVNATGWPNETQAESRKFTLTYVDLRVRLARAYKQLNSNWFIGCSSLNYPFNNCQGSIDISWHWLTLYCFHTQMDADSPTVNSVMAGGVACSASQTLCWCRCVLAEPVSVGKSAQEVLLMSLEHAFWTRPRVSNRPCCFA